MVCAQNIEIAPFIAIIQNNFLNSRETKRPKNYFNFPAIIFGITIRIRIYPY